MVPPTLEHERRLWSEGVQPLAGVDEAGRGPLAGPVVAAAVVFPEEFRIERVRDSKLIPEAEREKLYEEIAATALGIGVGVVGNDVIDRMNILQATILAMHKALDDLKVQPRFVLVDGNTFRHDTLPYRTIVDGDAKSFTIAAASVVAKVTRDRIMRSYHEQYPEYGFARHKGYGTRQHCEAIERYGLCPIHRMSFHIPHRVPGVPEAART